MGVVVLLTGPSSAGKTSIGHALRRVAPRPTVFLNGDEFDLPEQSEARRWLTTLDPARVAVLEDEFFTGFFGALAALGRAGLVAVGEVLLKKPDHLEAFRQATRDVKAHVVHVTCPQPLRVEREASRHDRSLGAAALSSLHEWVPPVADVMIDTTGHDPTAAALAICAALDLTA